MVSMSMGSARARVDLRHVDYILSSPYSVP
jgi:hypothetical protein